MKYIITIPASLTKGKNPKIVPAKHHLTEAFNLDQAQRRARSLNALGLATIEQLDEWIAKIETI